MAIEEAYSMRACRKRTTPRGTQPRKPTDNGAHEDTVRLEAFLLEVCDRAEGLVDVAAFATQDRRTELFPVFRLALEKVTYLGRVLGADDEQGAEPTRDAEPHVTNKEVYDDTEKKA
jgi:hypothetical protein